VVTAGNVGELIGPMEEQVADYPVALEQLNAQTIEAPADFLSGRRFGRASHQDDRDDEQCGCRGDFGASSLLLDQPTPTSETSETGV
jgi:hypothetical protein